MRGEGATLIDAVKEAIAVGREAGMPVQISHLKAAGRPNWGKVADALSLIDAARLEGLDVLADAYPYTASSTSMRTLLPDSALEGGVDAMLERLRDSGGRATIREALTSSRGESMPLRVGWENIMLVSMATRRDAEGRRLTEVAAARRREPVDTLLDLLVEEGGRGGVILFQMDEGRSEERRVGKECRL